MTEQTYNFQDEEHDKNKKISSEATYHTVKTIIKKPMPFNMKPSCYLQYAGRNVNFIFLPECYINHEIIISNLVNKADS